MSPKKENPGAAKQAGGEKSRQALDSVVESNPAAPGLQQKSAAELRVLLINMRQELEKVFRQADEFCQAGAVAGVPKFWKETAADLPAFFEYLKTRGILTETPSLLTFQKLDELIDKAFFSDKEPDSYLMRCSVSYLYDRLQGGALSVVELSLLPKRKCDFKRLLLRAAADPKCKTIEHWSSTEFKLMPIYHMEEHQKRSVVNAARRNLVELFDAFCGWDKAFTIALDDFLKLTGPLNKAHVHERYSLDPDEAIKDKKIGAGVFQRISFRPWDTYSDKQYLEKMLTGLYLKNPVKEGTFYFKNGFIERNPEPVKKDSYGKVNEEALKERKESAPVPNWNPKMKPVKKGG